MKRDHSAIRKTVSQLKKVYDFKGPLHFTDFLNLASINKLGSIYSRHFCQDQNVEFYDAADQEVIHKTIIDVQNCVRFYYKEKTMTLYRNEGIKEDGSNPHVPIPVYLLFDEEILYLDHTIFTDGNAGSGHTRYGTDHNFFYNMDWGTIFHRGPIYMEDGPEKWEFKRRRQAELLSKEPISLDYLRSIIFRCNADYKRACNLFGENKLYLVDPNMFNNERNYIKDYSIEIIGSGEKRTLKLTFETNQPVKKHEKHGYKIFDMKDNLIERVPIAYHSPTERKFGLEVKNIPNHSFKFEFWLYDILSIEEIIR
ncbi:DarT ssDNA thymidine ADP-ribosyltransferase family protein [Acetoanaerobium noterae]|uniref:DarT ssDNA thymidine ADP-ribosyltransferase family protein n=1 Tax=Acetoanaerobium noterae TaxID=745369 RepID=UPI00322158B1